MDLISFKNAIEESAQDKMVLLGNGFSIAWNHEIFTYRSLKERCVTLDKLSSDVFKALDTVDFEEVIQAFEHASLVCNCAKMDNSFLKNADDIKQILIDTIAENHPDTPDKVSQEEFESCVNFLSHYSRIFTLNYDMLLYWVLIRDMYRENEEKPKLKRFTDGFGYNDEDFLNWDGSSFKVHNIHGALHIFEDTETVKLNYNRTQVPLKSQFVDLIKKRNMFPLFVAEGDSIKKKERIRKSGYLTDCLNSLRKVGGKRSPTAMFTYGVSFSDNDNHIVEAIADNNCRQLYVGIYGEKDDPGNKAIEKKVNWLIRLRKDKNGDVPLSVNYYDASSARVWR